MKETLFFTLHQDKRERERETDKCNVIAYKGRQKKHESETDVPYGKSI
jgi:hypothetical protein